MTFPKYPEYKYSGVEWIGKVPAHWVVGPLRWYATIQGGVAKGKSYSDDTPTVDLPYLRVANVQDGHVDLSSVNTVTVALSEVGRYRLQPGDVLMNEGGDNDKLGRGTVWQGEIADCLHQNHVFAIRPNQYLLPYWLSMFTRSGAARSYFYLYSKQSTNLASISSSNVMSCPLPLPPQEEQRQVLRFLDHETARIDALVDEQQRLINLLKEKRQAVISHAVKSFGEGPEGKLGHYIDLLPGYAFPSSGFDHDDGIKLLRGANVSVGSTRWDDVVYWAYDKAQGLDEYWLKEGDLVIGMDRPWISGGARVARIRNSDLPALLLQRVARIRARSGLDQDFLELALSSQEFKDSIEADMTGVSVPHVSPEQISSFRIALPKLDKQSEIAQEARRELDKLENLLEEASINISLMQEHRSALISSAVTGKIDVRGWQAGQHAEQAEVLLAAEERAAYVYGKEPSDEV